MFAALRYINSLFSNPFRVLFLLCGNYKNGRLVTICISIPSKRREKCAERIGAFAIAILPTIHAIDFGFQKSVMVKNVSSAEMMYFVQLEMLK